MRKLHLIRESLPERSRLLRWNRFFMACILIQGLMNLGAAWIIHRKAAHDIAIRNVMESFAQTVEFKIGYTCRWENYDSDTPSIICVTSSTGQGDQPSVGSDIGATEQ